MSGISQDSASEVKEGKLELVGSCNQFNLYYPSPFSKRLGFITLLPDAWAINKSYIPFFSKCFVADCVSRTRTSDSRTTRNGIYDWA